ncbi:GntR family transcriptional regulator [Xanthomonas maliensis]|uniref:GntR family transcriptional regulator n=1 Tax=Xanthomonas maliensis TaxID=1321368 RepID=UPI0003A7F350|nr:GntR family transcriptional regulator [Xanthomonas maliensis]KAB7769680.1 GntR family transcriptional regulator [Xanthomonas maliensis]
MSGPVPTGPFRSSAAQTTRALLALREQILAGELPVTARLSELAVVQRLGVSRTPVRAALQRLCEEGLVRALPGGGYAVQAFGEADVHDAIELRGTLEGLAARLAAERGVAAADLQQAHALLETLDAIVAVPIECIDVIAYLQANEHFHALLCSMAGSAILEREMARTVRLPFASPSGMVQAQTTDRHSRQILLLAQQQHRDVVTAIEHRQGARAEALMREHARLAHRNLQQVLQSPAAREQVRGGALIEPVPLSNGGRRRRSLSGASHA